MTKQGLLLPELPFRPFLRLWLWSLVGPERPPTARPRTATTLPNQPNVPPIFPGINPCGDYVIYIQATIDQGTFIYIVLLAKMFPFEILDKNVPDVAELIFQHMDVDALVRLRSVSKQWKKTIDKILFGEKMPVARYLQAASEGQQDICRCGQSHVMYVHTY